MKLNLYSSGHFTLYLDYLATDTMRDMTAKKDFDPKKGRVV